MAGDQGVLALVLALRLTGPVTLALTARPLPLLPIVALIRSALPFAGLLGRAGGGGKVELVSLPSLPLSLRLARPQVLPGL